MKFIEYIEKTIKENLEFDAVIGDVDMPATFGFCDDWVITDYCMEKYGDLLESEIEVRKDPTGWYTDVVIVDYDNYKKGEKFAYAVAGYVSESEWNKLFVK